ncbi:hypothetical protein [Phormidesmis priestleyi]|nr:hypothetical protein [Phormidesmis priestleyi]
MFLNKLRPNQCGSGYTAQIVFVHVDLPVVLKLLELHRFTVL